MIFHSYVSLPEAREDDPSSFLKIGIRMFLRSLSDGADEKWGLVGHRGDTHPILVVVIWRKNQQQAVSSIFVTPSNISEVSPKRIKIWVCLKIGYIPNEIAIFHRDNDQQNHWV